MQKNIIRFYKSTYNKRWPLLKHNLKNSELQLMSLHDKLITNNICSGSTLCLNFMGLQYIKLIKNLTVEDNLLNYRYGPINEKYNNLIVDWDRFKYKTLYLIAKEVIELCNTLLLDNGKMIISFNYQFLKFNRLKFNFEKSIAEFLLTLQTNNINLSYRLPTTIPNTNSYGDCFFIFTFKDCR